MTFKHARQCHCRARGQGDDGVKDTLVRVSSAGWPGRRACGSKGVERGATTEVVTGVRGLEP
jgi:hypothetical protein